MTVFSKDFDWRQAEKIYAFKAGTEVPAEALADAKAAGVTKEKANEGSATASPPRATDKA